MPSEITRSFWRTEATQWLLDRGRVQSVNYEVMRSNQQIF
jgi:hypothetical protein